MTTTRQEDLRQQLAAVGFDDVRFASVAGGDAPGGALRAWLEAGMHGEMHWMERTAEKRLDPSQVLAGVRSIILLGINYRQPGPPAADPAQPVWARYALYQDYHDTIRPGLAAAGALLEKFHAATKADYRYYVDTGPVLERAWAARAGLGFVGKNAMLISRIHGNWLLLAAILTRLELVPDPPIRKQFTAPEIGLLCGKCTRCLDACPTAAFAAPGVLDARRCISYQTIENKGVIPRDLRPGIGNRVFGCDVCLEVCPWNRFAQDGRGLLLASRRDLGTITLADLLTLTPERFASVFQRTPIKRLKLTGLLRNACVVAGNSDAPSLLPFLMPLASSHPSSLVRAHAVWAVHRLGGAAALHETRAREADPMVLAEYAAESAGS